MDVLASLGSLPAERADGRFLKDQRLRRRSTCQLAGGVQTGTPVPPTSARSSFSSSSPLPPGGHLPTCVWGVCLKLSLLHQILLCSVPAAESCWVVPAPPSAAPAEQFSMPCQRRASGQRVCVDLWVPGCAHSGVPGVPFSNVSPSGAAVVDTTTQFAWHGRPCQPFLASTLPSPSSSSSLLIVPALSHEFSGNARS